MNTRRSAVYFFCVDLDRDPVASHVLASVRRIYSLSPTEITVDNHAVLCFEDQSGNRFFHVQTDEVLSHNYSRYLPVMIEHFQECDVAGVINWHEGANAPDQIFCVHTTGDVPSGVYGAADSVALRNLLLKLDELRRKVGLDQYETLTEATHWSGIPHGQNPASISKFNVPLVDIEIGSSGESWSDPVAAEVVARAIHHVFDPAPELIRSLLCIGGVHFEKAYRDALFTDLGDKALVVSHILANQWIVSGGYSDETGLEKLRTCIASIREGVDGIVFHDNLKAPCKQIVRTLGAELGIPVFKHKKLRQPGDLPVW